MSDAERKRYSYFDREESSFFFLQASEPQTLAYALTDSPVGWLAWMIGKFQLLTDNNGDFLTAVDRDTFLTDVTLYWATGTIGSAMRIYRENRLPERKWRRHHTWRLLWGMRTFRRRWLSRRLAGLLKHIT